MLEVNYGIFQHSFCSSFNGQRMKTIMPILICGFKIILKIYGFINDFQRQLSKSLFDMISRF